MRKKIFVRAPCLSQTGYGEQARFALRALRSREDLYEIFIQPIPWGKSGWIWEDSEFRNWMDERIIETQILIQKKEFLCDLSLQITIPNEFQKLAPINFGYTAGIETTKVAALWLKNGNEVMDKILTVSNHSKDVYESTVVEAINNRTQEKVDYSLETPVEVVWETTPRSDVEEIVDFEPKNEFNFLTVCQMSKRKNLVNTVVWFVEEFIDKEVGLIIKGSTVNNSIIDKEATEKTLSAILEKYPDRKCSVSLLHGDLSSGQMRSLYTHPKIKSIVSIAHGEGFGLPLFEAAREGLPVVSVGWSGQLDFLRHDGKDYFANVNYKLDKIQPDVVWENVLVEGSEWAYANQGSYKMTLRMVYNKWDEYKKQAEELQEIILTKFSDEKLFAGFIDALDLSIDQEEKYDQFMDFIDEM